MYITIKYRYVGRMSPFCTRKKILKKKTHKKRKGGEARGQKSCDPLTESSGEVVCSVASLSLCFRALTKVDGHLPVASPLSTAPLKCRTTHKNRTAKFMIHKGCKISGINNAIRAIE
jgi:hypothetical protein